MPRFFGERPTWVPGTNFADRAALAGVGIHPPTQAGISYSEREGADSIVLSGGYPDDEDHGDLIIYTGMGSRDPGTGQQIADQEFDRGNKALGVSKNEGLPVRVSRGSTHSSPFSPTSGYTYAGIYYVEDYWHETGQDGFKVWRFRLIKEQPTLVTTPTPSTTSVASVSATQRRVSTTIRVVRDTAIAKAVKKQHKHICQVCGVKIETPAGPYAEGAHIQPLGRPHNGPDVAENILCLCPNHHVMFDSGSFGIANDLSLIGLPGAIRTAAGHSVGLPYLEYHREHYGLS